jgi:hypothetical protein
MSAEQNVSEAPVQASLALPVSMAGESGDGAGQQDSSGANPGPGLGQSKSSRRRRRKRKGKGGEANVLAEGGSDVDAGPETGGDEPADAPAQAATASNSGGEGQQARAAQNQQQPAPGKRWKKKFRDRQRPQRNENPGNQAAPQPQGGYSQQDGNGSGGSFKRKSRPQQQPQQRRARAGFVGPMDHSYRAVNGNYAESSPSTIEVHGNYKQRGHHRNHQPSDAQPIDHSMPRAIPIAEDAQTHIYFFVDDLFVTAKIQESARKLGIKVGFVKNEKDDVARLTSGEEQDKPALIVFDLNNANAKPLTLVPKLKTKLKRSVSIVGFLSHLQGDLKAKAVEAGCDAVMPRAAFSQNLPNLLRRYGIQDEPEEINYNQ